ATYARSFRRFAQLTGVTPGALLRMDEAGLRRLLVEFVSRCEERGFSSNYVESMVKPVYSWLEFNGRPLGFRVKIRNRGDTPTLVNERVPTREELRRLLLAANVKARVAAVLVAHAGVRLEVIGDYNGLDGLRVGDLPELEIDGVNVVFRNVPTMIIVRRNLSKARHQYFTFLSEEGCNYLKDFLEMRIRSGERISAASPVVASGRTGRFMMTVNVGRMIRLAMRRAGLPWRPYVLRSYFDTQLMFAESRGLVIRDYRTFWMGHKGDIENRYTTNRCRLPENIVEDMRNAYRRSMEFLQTIPTGSERKIRDEFRRQLLLVAGFSSEEVEKMDLGMSDEELQRKIRERLLGGMVNNGARQRIVSLEEVEKHISEGWEYVATLPNGKAILRIPV
ncbi:MAG: hypothetical protein QW334_01615, partial [Thermofilum sp.]